VADVSRGLLHTSVIVDHPSIDAARAEAARGYGRVFAAVRATGRSHRARLADLLIASTAAANGLPVYTRNPADFRRLDEIVEVVEV
jgi:hypothetical protein